MVVMVMIMMMTMMMIMMMVMVVIMKLIKSSVLIFNTDDDRTDGSKLC